MNAEETLGVLLEGNRRFREGRPLGKGRDAARRTKTAAGQRPLAIVLACSDSRVPPEILFDAGIGDLFVVRVAGNVEDDLVTGSIEYAAANLEIPLLLVLGHTRCGALTVAVSGIEVEGRACAILDSLGPAVRAARDDPGDPVEAAARRNALMTAGRLRKSAPILASLVEGGRLAVRAALYDIVSGAVTLLDE
jgi:carbonic anhydrase